MSETKKEFNNWHCETCQKSMTQSELPEHLTKEHGITDDSGKRSMLSHVDGRDFYDWTYQWTIGGMKFVQHTRSLRRGADKQD